MAVRGAIGDGRPRLVVVEEIALASATDPYLGLRALSTYSGCSVRWLRDRLTDVAHPLPCFRLPGGKILVRRSDFDGWIAAYRTIWPPNPTPPPPARTNSSRARQAS